MHNQHSTMTTVSIETTGPINTIVMTVTTTVTRESINRVTSTTTATPSIVKDSCQTLFCQQSSHTVTLTFSFSPPFQIDANPARFLGQCLQRKSTIKKIILDGFFSSISCAKRANNCRTCGLVPFSKSLLWPTRVPPSTLKPSDMLPSRYKLKANQLQIFLVQTQQPTAQHFDRISKFDVGFWIGDNNEYLELMITFNGARRVYPGYLIDRSHASVLVSTTNCE